MSDELIDYAEALYQRLDAFLDRRALRRLLERLERKDERIQALGARIARQEEQASALRRRLATLGSGERDRVLGWIEEAREAIQNALDTLGES